MIKPIGVGYRGFKQNPNKPQYTKLVVLDKSKPLVQRPKLQPSIGHNPRRQAILDRRKEKNK